MINAYIKKKERLQINNLHLYPKEKKKIEQTKLKVSRKKETANIRTDMHLIHLTYRISWLSLAYFKHAQNTPISIQLHKITY